MLEIIFHVLLSGHYLFVPDCGPDQAWQFIDEAGIHACTATYEAHL